MKRSLQRIVLLGLVICFITSCASLSQSHKEKYGLLKSAVLFSSEKVIGEYGDQIPDSFDGKQFMELVKDKIPEDYLDALDDYKYEVETYGWYFLIKVIDDKKVILFDYSCSTQIDGPLLDSQEAFDLNNLGAYDPCK